MLLYLFWIPTCSLLYWLVSDDSPILEWELIAQLLATLHQLTQWLHHSVYVLAWKIIAAQATLIVLYVRIWE